ncbi:hypothetical protein [Streptomyces parvulus]|uniref:Uncharacterized protein n=1 Tax=Streptomyces parvulus TaxID=146923 RepID=A0A369VCH3_9ACTN|nr:hypothetical protein [Streptomyces parvulus]RDD90501.1 hypothetical protein DVZ84_03865 [Streptomyces parvulus]
MDLQHTRDPRPSTAFARDRACASGPVRPPRRHLSGPAPLTLPAGLRTGLGHDAVGTSPEHGERILACLPRAGCVFADQDRWWWIVPAGSDIGVAWPHSAHYLSGDPSWTRTGGETRPAGPRLVHGPDGDSPYTAPIPLYFLVCRLTGVTPHWSLTP